MSDSPPSEVISLEVGPYGLDPECAMVVSSWPGDTPAEDAMSVALGDVTLFHGHPDDLARMGADLMFKARQAQREMLTTRVQEGRQLADRGASR